MNRKLKFYRKNLFFIRNNIYILFNKKIIKNIFLLNRKKFFFFKRYIKIVILFYLSCLSHYFDYFLPCYNLMRNVFFLFCKIYNITLEKIKYNIIFLFNIIFKKNLIKNLLKIGKLKKKKKISIFFNLNLSIFFNKDTRKNIDKNIRWRKRNLKISYSINKVFKKFTNKKIKIRIFPFFFNGYKFNLFSMLIRYFNKILKFNLKKSFILYWQRYYVYHLKRFFVFIEYTISKYFNYIIKKFKFYFTFINLKKINKKKYETFFCYLFFFNQKPYDVLNRYKFYKYFNNTNKLLTFNYFKRSDFNLFLFNKLNIKISSFHYSFDKKLQQLKTLIKFKFLFYLKNFFFLFFFWYLKYWFNYYFFFYLKKKIIIINYKNQFIDKNIIKIGLEVLESKIWNRNSFLNFNFFFYDNIIIKKRD